MSPCMPCRVQSKSVQSERDSGLAALILVFGSNLHCANSWGSGTTLSWALSVSQDYSIINRVLLRSSESQSVGWNLDRVGSQRQPSHTLLDRHHTKLICCIWNEIMNGKVAFQTAERVQWYLFRTLWEKLTPNIELSLGDSRGQQTKGTSQERQPEGADCHREQECSVTHPRCFLA